MLVCALGRHQNTTNFEADGVCGGPLFAPLLAPKAVLSSSSLVVVCALITSDKFQASPASQACTRLEPGATGTIYESTVSMYEYTRGFSPRWADAGLGSAHGEMTEDVSKSIP